MSRKNKLYFNKQQVQATVQTYYKASSSSNSKTFTSKSPNRSAPSPSPSLPQTLKSKAQPRGAHGFGLVQGKLKREGRLLWILMHGSYFGWWFIYGCSIPKKELEHTDFISFPQIYSSSLFPDPFVDQLLRWVHSDIKFHLFGFCIFLYFAWKSPRKTLRNIPTCRTKEIKLEGCKLSFAAGLN